MAKTHLPKINHRILLWLESHFDWLVLVAALLFSWWLMSSTFGYQNGNFYIDPKLHSDFGAHLPLIRSFSFGDNWPPEYPFFAGQPIRYHYLFYLVVGLCERVGLNIGLAMNLLSTAGMTLMLIMVYRIGLLFFKRKSAGVLAIILVLFNGSLAFVEYFNRDGWTLTALGQIPHQLQFASFGPWSGRLVSAFWNLNIFTNQRHLALSYGLLLWLIYPLLRSLYQKVRLPIYRHLAIILGFTLFPLLHQAGHLMLVFFTVGWLVLNPRRSARLLATYSLAVFGSIMVFWFGTSGAGQLPVWQPFYLATDHTWWGLGQYWWANLGGYILMFIPAIVWSIKKRNAFLFLLSGLFVVANTWRLSTDMINNHKLINLAVIGLQIITAGLLVKTWRIHLVRPLIILAVVILTFSGLMDFFPIRNDEPGPMADYPRSPIISWIMENTPPRAQFLTSSYFYNPASLAGRPIFLDYGYHAWSMGYDDRSKRQALTQLYGQDITLDQWCRIMASFHLSYVLLGPGEDSVEDKRIDVKASMISRQQPTQTTPDNWRIYDTDLLCQKK